MRKRILSLGLSLAMLLSLLPGTALAAKESDSGSRNIIGSNVALEGESLLGASDGPESFEGDAMWQPGEDGAYVVSFDADFQNMVQTINQASSGSSLTFRFLPRRTNNGTIYQFTSTSAITVPEGVSVTIDLDMCDMLFNVDTEESTIITNNGMLSVHGKFCTSSQYGRIGSKTQTIINHGTMELDTVYIAGMLENESQLILSQTSEDTPGTRQTCTVGTLSNSGSVSANNCDFSSISSSAGQVNLTDCGAGPLGVEETALTLTGDAVMMIEGTSLYQSVFRINHLALSDTSKLTVENTEFGYDLQDAGVTVAETATLSIRSGTFFFYPYPYLETKENVTVLRDKNYFLIDTNPYLISQIEEGSVAPQLEVTQFSWVDENGNITVSISTNTEDAQVFYSIDPAQNPIQCQTDIKNYRTTSVPVGTTIYAVALKEGCPVAEQTFTVTEPPAPPEWMPTISPSDSQIYQGSVTVTIAPQNPGGEVYYTINGQDPGYPASTAPGTGTDVQVGDGETAMVARNGIRYTGPFTLTSSATVKAVEFSPAGDQSKIASRQYVVVPNSGGSSDNNSGGSTDNDNGNSDSSGNQTDTTKNPDGSTTTTVTKPDGTVTTTTTDKNGNKTQTVEKPNGSTTTTVDKKDGSSSTTTVSASGAVEATVDLSESAVVSATSRGQAVALPMPEVTASSSWYDAPTVTVNLPVGGSAKVEIPVEDVTVGTVAILVKADGSEQIIKTSLVTSNGVAVTLGDGDTVKIVDNSKPFYDVSRYYWGADAIDFATSRQIFSGTSSTTFSPDMAMNRAMIVTVLAAYEGVDTTSSGAWYETSRQWAMKQGISDGTNMDQTLTREQLATMLWRYAGSPSAGSLSGYPDAGSVSGYASQAMAWAVENGLISGMDGNLAPQGQATRAQVATILMRFVESQNG